MPLTVANGVHTQHVSLHGSARLHRYAYCLYSHSVTTLRPTADHVELPPVSGRARP